MVDLHATMDYREYLRLVFEERKVRNPLFSYRLWARQLQIDPAQLFRILSKDLHLPLRHVDTVVENLKLLKNDAEYFKVMVQWGRARTEKEKKSLVIKLLGLRDVRRKTLSREQYLFFHEWYHASVRCLIGAGTWKGNAKKLGQMLIPAIPAEKVEASIQLQENLGLLKKAGENWALGEAHLSTDEHEIHKAIRHYQSEMLEKGREALDRFTKQERDISSLTFAVDKACEEDIRALIQECRRQIQRRIEESGKPDRVMHLGFSLFPTAWIEENVP